jgi:hypothetical protein
VNWKRWADWSGPLSATVVHAPSSPVLRQSILFTAPLWSWKCLTKVRVHDYRYQTECHFKIIIYVRWSLLSLSMERIHKFSDPPRNSHLAKARISSWVPSFFVLSQTADHWTLLLGRASGFIGQRTRIEADLWRKSRTGGSGSASESERRTAQSGISWLSFMFAMNPRVVSI